MILITGASGFIGKRLLKKLVKTGVKIRVIVRKKSVCLDLNIEEVIIDLEKWVSSSKDCDKLDNCLKNSLIGVDVVIHLAGIAHGNGISQEKYSKINRDLTIKLASYANKYDVKRFIFSSSIKVNGEMTFSKYSHLLCKKNKSIPKYFDSSLDYIPTEPYAVSKYEAELELEKLKKQMEMTIIVVRIPLVYGEGAKGNYEKLTKLIKLGIPLPFKSADNKRSLISIDNLCSFLIHISDTKKHKDIMNETFLISDNTDLSFADILEKIAKSQNRKLYLFKFPVNLLIRFLNIIGCRKTAVKIFGDLRINKNKVSELTGWKSSE